jgi:hypothetical protein
MILKFPDQTTLLPTGYSPERGVVAGKNILEPGRAFYAIVDFKFGTQLVGLPIQETER